MSSTNKKKRTLPTVPGNTCGRTPQKESLQATPSRKFNNNSTIKKPETPASAKKTPRRITGTIPVSKSSTKPTLRNANTPVRSPRLSKKTLHETPSCTNGSTKQTLGKKSDNLTTKREDNKNDSTDFDHSTVQQNASFLLTSGSEAMLPTSYDNSSITVAVRLRPFSQRETSMGQDNVITMSGNVTHLNSPTGNQHDFIYDFSFWSFDSTNPLAPFVSQADVYNCVAKPLIDWSFDGYNTCLFAYGQVSGKWRHSLGKRVLQKTLTSNIRKKGTSQDVDVKNQTGSGKSYTIMGYEEEEAGIIPRFSKDLFIKTAFYEQEENICYSIEISYYEIYNEKIFDLLSFNDGNKQRLCVREHPDLGPYVQGLSKHIVANHADILDWLEVGNKNRATASTGMNDKSSRSHSVFTMVLTQVKSEKFEDTETQVQKTSRINLIDLAGSERASKVLDYNYGKDENIANTRLKEGGCINKSLHTLGKVISILADNQMNPKKKATYIPYRDSVLTWLLKESLGGNSRTTMLATISPASAHYSETLSALRYAQQARNIVNNAKINEDPKSKLIREMLTEIQRLKESQRKSGDFGHNLEREVVALRGKLNDAQTTLAASTRNWQEQLAASEKKQKEATKHLRRSGVSFTKLEHHLPSLVNLNEDPQLAEVLLYILQEGVTNVGSREPENTHDIQLRGNLVADLHCMFEYKDGVVTLTPVADAQTYVNGCLIGEDVILHHGDRIVVGGDHFFRITHPKEAVKLKEKLTNRRESFKDFEYAKDELIKKQNERLEAELEEARLKAEADAMLQIKEAQIKAEEDMKVQREYFEKQLSVLQNKLDDTAGKKKEVEEDHQSAQEIISQLRQHQKLLEDEIMSNRKRLNMEALAAKQILEDTKNNHRRILKDLEEERRKIENDVEEMKNLKTNREKMRASITISVNQPDLGKKYFTKHGRQKSDTSEPRDLLKISLMLREANQINQKLKQPFVFTRDDICADGKAFNQMVLMIPQEKVLSKEVDVKIQVTIRVRVFDKERQKTALLSVDKFEEELNNMKDLTAADMDTIALLDYRNYTWEDHHLNDYENIKSPRMSLPCSNFSMIIDDDRECSNYYSQPRDSTMMNATDLSKLSKSTNPVESTRLSSVHSETGGTQTEQISDLVQLKSSMFDTILDDHVRDADISIVSKLLKLICSIYTDWKNIDIPDKTMTNGGTLLSNISFADDPLVMLACNLKALKDVSAMLATVHEAVGLEELKAMTYTFKEIVEKACNFVRNNATSIKNEASEKAMKLFMFQLAEISGAMSLAAVDHINNGDDEKRLYFHQDHKDMDLIVYFVKHQNRFLNTMITEALENIRNGVFKVKSLQLNVTHEMTEDLVDGIMNILTSATTLLQRCQDLFNVYAGMSISSAHAYHAKECFLMRQLLTSIVDYNENVYNLLEHSKDVAANCDTLNDFLDVPIELADTTKRICVAGKELVQFVSMNKNLDDELKTTLQQCLEKFEFAGKTVRVGVAILIQEVESELNVNEEQSIVSLIQNDEPFSRETSACPLNRTSLDVSVLNPELRSKFGKNRKSSINPDLFISKYMDTTDL